MPTVQTKTTSYSSCGACSTCCSDLSTPFVIDQYGVSFTSAGSYLTAFGFVGIFLYTVFKPLSGVAFNHWLMATGLALIATSMAPMITALILAVLPLVVYICLVGTMWSIAYPIRQTDVLSLFSKVIKSPLPRGLLGIVSVLGSREQISFAVAA